MEYSWKYKTPEGFDDLVMCGDDEALTGLWFEGSRDDWRSVRECKRRVTPVFRETCRWLDAYFAGRDPGFKPNYRFDGNGRLARLLANLPVLYAGFPPIVVTYEARLDYLRRLIRNWWQTTLDLVAEAKGSAK